MEASATTRVLSVTWTAKVTKPAVRRLWSREVLRFLPCRLRSRRGRPNAIEAKYWGRHVCPAQVSSLESSAVQLR